MDVFRVLVLSAVVAAAGSLATDDGCGGTAGSGHRDGGYAGPGTRTDGPAKGSGAGKADDGARIRTAARAEYVDGDGARFLIVGFCDGSWFAFGME